MTEQFGFTHVATMGAFVSLAVGFAVLVLVRLVTKRPIGLFELLEACVAAGAVAALQVVMVDEGFGKLHVAYLFVFLTLPLLGGIVLLAALVPSQRPGRWALVGAGALLLLGAVGIYGTHIEPRWIRTERVALDVAPIDGGDELRIGVLSDLQTDDITDYERRAIDRLMREEPDLILVAGDYFQSDGKDFEAAADEIREVMGGLSAPGGVFLVEGDVDSPGRMTVITEGQDLVWVDHEVVSTEVEGHTVHIGGISPSFESPQARATITQLADQDPADLRILLSHRPDVAYHVPADGVDLVVAGHTHGGQVSLPWIGPPITMSNVPRDVAAGGLHEIDGVPIYLSNGVGMERATAPQVRLGTRPSVGVVTLS